MRILHIDTGRELRGGQNQVLLLMDGLRAAGHSSELLARKSGALSPAAAVKGFTTGVASLRNVAVRSRHVDIVHVHDAHAHTLAAIACRSRFVVSRRVAFALKRGLLSRWKYARPVRYLAVSEFVARVLNEAGVQRNKIDVVYDGVVLNQVIERHSPADFAIVALDSSDPLKGRSITQSAALLAGVPVIFSKDLATDLRYASVFVYITQSEGLGSAVLLAMSCGVPVIASRTGGLPEVVIDGECGYLVENDAEAVAHAIRTVKGDPRLAHYLGQQGRSRTESYFTQEHMVQATLQVYQRALIGSQ